MDELDPRILKQRMADLERELAALRRRVSNLELGVPARTTRPDEPAVTAAPVPAKSTPVALPAGFELPPLPVERKVAEAPAPAAIGPQPAQVHPGNDPVSTPDPVAAGVDSQPAQATVRTGRPEDAGDREATSGVGELLAALGLLPPTGTRSGEAQIGAWWATRIGALLAVLGGVFFGVYLNLDAPPWVKLVQVFILSGVMVGAGLWLERRMQRLGGVVSGAGLALGYFAAFGASAIPALRVVETAPAAFGLQAAAVLAVAAFAVWRRIQTVATMAVLLGFVTAFFSLPHGAGSFAVASGLGLSAIAVLLRRWQGWSGPLLASVSLVHILVAAVALDRWDAPPEPPGFLIAFGVVAAAFGLHVLSVVLDVARPGGSVTLVQKWVQPLNTSLGVLAGFLVTLAVARHSTDMYFYGAGAVLAGCALWAWYCARPTGLLGLFAVKASALVALGILSQFDSKTAWLTLLVEAFVLLAAATRTRRTVLYVTAFLVWLLALVVFADDVSSAEPVWIAMQGLAVAVYVLAATAWLAWLARALAHRSGAGATPAATVVLAVLALVPIGLAASETWMEVWLVPALVGMAVALGGLARVLRSVVPLAAAALAFLTAHAALQMDSVEYVDVAWLWADGAAVVVVSVAAMLLALRWRTAERDVADTVVFTLGALAYAAGVTLLLKSFGEPYVLALAGLAGVALWAAALRVEQRAISFLALAALPLAGLLAAVHDDAACLGTVFCAATAWLWVPTLVVPVLFLLRTPPVGQGAGAEAALKVGRALLAVTGVLWSWRAADEQFGTPGLALALLAVGAAYVLVGQLRACAASRAAASGVLAYGLFVTVLDRTAWTTVDTAWAVFAAVAGLILGFALLPLAYRGRAGWCEGRLERAWRAAHAAAAVLAVIVLASLGKAVWAAQGSVLWAVGGLVVFALGLALRSRAHRVAGLVALALCIPRVFVHDLDSTVHRIAAFAVLGVLLLGVGFSYQRFRHLIEGDKPGSAGGDAEGPGR